MKYNKGTASNIVLIIILLISTAIGTAYFLGKESIPEKEPVDSDQNQPTEQDQNPIINTPPQELPTDTPQINTDDIKDQAAFLISAYSKNNKNYIDVDYIEVLYREASLQAQVADGQCPNVTDCYAFPNGYKRNHNPLVRTFEISSNPLIEINGLLNFYAKDQDNQNISFDEFKTLSSSITSYVSYKPPFEKPLTYIKIDIQNNKVTKIVEPYQE